MKYGIILVRASLEEAIADSETKTEQYRNNLLIMREWIEKSPYESEFIDISLEEYKIIRSYM